MFEHITTREAVRFVLRSPPRVAATITAHHLLLNRNALFAGGIRPHHYCMPILKREEDRQALIQAAVSGNPKFFLGTDSAPHARDTKEAACGCAGIYTAHAGIELYAEIFGAYSALDKLEGFASVHGAEFLRSAAQPGQNHSGQGNLGRARAAAVSQGHTGAVPRRWHGGLAHSLASPAPFNKKAPHCTGLCFATLGGGAAMPSLRHVDDTCVSSHFTWSP